jgi:hypothetical protein
MAQLLVIPAATLEGMKQDGVQLNKLLDVNYIAEHVAVSDLADIHIATSKFPFSFCEATKVTIAPTALTLLMKASNSVDGENIKLQEIYGRVERRVLNERLVKGAHEAVECFEYTLYPVDENLWVAVQKSLHTSNGDPARLSVKVNCELFNSMINELRTTRTMSNVASTKLFTYYLEALSFQNE